MEDYNLLNIGSHIPCQFSKELHKETKETIQPSKSKKKKSTDIEYTETNHSEQAAKQGTSKIQPFVAIVIPIIFWSPSKGAQQ